MDRVGFRVKVRVRLRIRVGVRVRVSVRVSVRVRVRVGFRRSIPPPWARCRQSCCHARSPGLARVRVKVRVWMRL